MPATVAVLEPTAVTRLGVVQALEGAGHATVQAGTFEGLCDQLVLRRVDVVVTALYLDGSEAPPALDVVRRLTAAGSPVLVYSNSALVPDVLGALHVGASAFLRKGGDVEPLLRAVDRLAREGSGAPPLMTAEVAAAVRLRDRFALTQAELQVLSCISQHMSNAEIARRRFVSEETVKTQIQSLRNKLNAANRAAAVREAHRHGLLGRWSLTSNETD